MPDEYTLKARLWPALLAGMPLLLALSTILNLEVWRESAVSGASGIGLTFLLAQVARTLGFRLEPIMFDRWGGRPSVAMLRHGNDYLNQVTKALYHQNITRLFGFPMPTPAEETDNPQKAEHAYEAATASLKAATRENTKKRFPLLFQENVNYGFCRNMRGLKPVGIVLAFFGAAVAAQRLYFDHAAGSPISVLAVVTAGASLLMLYVWIGVVTIEWPKAAAFGYADRLLEATNVLVAEKGGKP